MKKKKACRLPEGARHGTLPTVYKNVDGFDGGEFKVAYALLHPLLNGKPVVLKVDDGRLPKRSRVRVVRLFLAPLASFGLAGEGIVAGLETHGCEVFDPSTVTRMSFLRLGLSVRLSTAIARELNVLFKKGGKNGTT